MSARMLDKTIWRDLPGSARGWKAGLWFIGRAAHLWPDVQDIRHDNKIFQDSLDEIIGL